MRQEGGRPFGLISALGYRSGEEALAGAKVRRLILRCAQNDKGRGGACLDRTAGRLILRYAQNDKGRVGV